MFRHVSRRLFVVELGDDVASRNAVFSRIGSPREQQFHRRYRKHGRHQTGETRTIRPRERLGVRNVEDQLRMDSARGGSGSRLSAHPRRDGNSQTGTRQRRCRSSMVRRNWQNGQLPGEDQPHTRLTRTAPQRRPGQLTPRHAVVHAQKVGWTRFVRLR